MSKYQDALEKIKNKHKNYDYHYPEYLPQEIEVIQELVNRQELKSNKENSLIVFDKIEEHVTSLSTLQVVNVINVNTYNKRLNKVKEGVDLLHMINIIDTDTYLKIADLVARNII